MNQQTNLKKGFQPTVWAILLVCAAPVICSYLAFYVWKPTKTANYGTIVSPQRPYPNDLLFAPIENKAIVNTTSPISLDSQKPQTLAAFKGKWVMLHVDQGGCDEACVKKLYLMRQLRVMQGKERERIGLLWLVSDQQSIDPRILQAYPEVQMWRWDAQRYPQLASWLSLDGAKDKGTIRLLDPFGDLMLIYPDNPDPKKIHRDLSRLLRVSRVG